MRRQIAETFGLWTWRLRAEPSFLIIGAQKSATTSLRGWLRAHPDVARVPGESQFFAYNFDRGVRWYRAKFPLRASLRPWPGRRRRIVGEKATFYLDHPLAPERVRMLIPEVKVIVVLREPASRAFAQYRHEVRKGREPRTFADALACEECAAGSGPDRFAGVWDVQHSEYETKAYVARSEYGPKLDRWYSALPREQILVVRFEDLTGDRSHDELQRVCRFLGIRRLDRPFGAVNVGDSAEPDPAVLEQLRRRFDESNAAVSQLTGITWVAPEATIHSE